jgi:hypothetical protein
MNGYSFGHGGAGNRPSGTAVILIRYIAFRQKGRSARAHVGSQMFAEVGDVELPAVRRGAVGVSPPGFDGSR